MTSSSRTIRLVNAILALALGGGLAFVALEGVSRWYFNYRSVYDSVLGSVVAPGHTFRSRVEGSGIAHYDAGGARRPAWLGPRDGLRILCIGDSFTEAFQVSDDEVYTTLVEQALDAAGIQVAVLNVGRSGLSVADYVANAAAYRTAATPSWTVVQVTGRDFYEETWQTTKTHFKRACPACPVEVVPMPPVRDGRARRIMRWLRNQSALVGFGIHRWQELTGVTRQNSEPPPPDPRVFAAAATPHEYPVKEELRMLAQAYDGRLTLLLLGRFDPRAPGRDTSDEAVIRHAARDLGISLACSKDEYEALAARGQTPNGFANTSPISGHLNANGHAAAAHALTRELLRLHAEGRL
jgi:hypothetical protein